MVLLIGKVTNMLATAAPQPLTYSRHSGGPEKNPNFSCQIEEKANLFFQKISRQIEVLYNTKLLGFHIFGEF